MMYEYVVVVRPIRCVKAVPADFAVRLYVLSILRCGSGELEIKREAAWAISNGTSGGDSRQIQQLVQYGCIPPLTELLRVMDPRIMQVRRFVPCCTCPAACPKLVYSRDDKCFCRKDCALPRTAYLDNIVPCEGVLCSCCTTFLITRRVRNSLTENGLGIYYHAQPLEWQVRHLKSCTSTAACWFT